MMKAMSAQMVEYNSTLTVFTVRDVNDPACTYNLPNVKLMDFDPKKLLLEYNYGEGFFFITHTACYSYIQVSITKLTITLVVDEILSWKGKDLTRTSDILRLI